MLDFTGCAGLGRGGGPPIAEVHLFGLPTALTAVGSSEPNGVGIRVYASAAGGSQGIPIRQGHLDVLVFDQSAEGLNPQTKEPLKTWSFQAADLEPYRATSMMGTGYTLELRWNQVRPKGKVLTVVARYVKPDKSEIYSPPTVISGTAH